MSVAPPSSLTVLARKIPESPLPVTTLSRNSPRTDFSWAMPHTPLFRANTWRTASRSVPEAQRPFFLKPLTVSERMLTSRSGLPAAPMTQMPLPAFAHMFPARLPIGAITVLGPAPTRRSRDLRMTTLSR